jgi:hypothetical protein
LARKFWRANFGAQILADFITHPNTYKVLTKARTDCTLGRWNRPLLLRFQKKKRRKKVPLPLVFLSKNLTFILKMSPPWYFLCKENFKKICPPS